MSTDTEELATPPPAPGAGSSGPSGEEAIAPPPGGEAPEEEGLEQTLVNPVTTSLAAMISTAAAVYECPINSGGPANRMNFHSTRSSDTRYPGRSHVLNR